MSRARSGSRRTRRRAFGLQAYWVRVRLDRSSSLLLSLSRGIRSGSAAAGRSPVAPFPAPRDLNDRLVLDLIDAVKGILRKESADRLRDVYLIGDIEKDVARSVIERLRELANDNAKPITLYINSAGGNVTDGLAIHDSIRQIVARGIEVTIVVQGMAYSMGSVVLQAASEGRRLALPHSWIMIHEPAKWAGWQSTSAAAQHLDRLKQMQAQIYQILAKRSGRPLAKIIRDTKRTDFYLDAQKAIDYGLIDAVVAGLMTFRPRRGRF